MNCVMKTDRVSSARYELDFYTCIFICHRPFLVSEDLAATMSQKCGYFLPQRDGLVTAQ